MDRTCSVPAIALMCYEKKTNHRLFTLCKALWEEWEMVKNVGPAPKVLI
jgi:hypothetical protein